VISSGHPDTQNHQPCIGIDVRMELLDRRTGREIFLRCPFHAAQHDRPFGVGSNLNTVVPTIRVPREYCPQAGCFDNEGVVWFHIG
jgi:hypothetical protein